MYLGILSLVSMLSGMFQNLNFCIHMFECVLVMFGCSRKLLGDHICGEAAVIVVISVGGGGGGV